MLEPTSLIPEALLPVAAAALVWSGVNYFGLTPVIEERLADKLYQPACEAGLALAEQNAPAPVLPQPVDPRSQALNLLKQSPLMAHPFFKHLGLSDMVDEAARLAENLSPKVPQPPKRDIDYGSVCECAVFTALDRHHWQFTLHTATARLYTPATVRNFDAEIAKVIRSEACGKLPFGV